LEGFPAYFEKKIENLSLARFLPTHEGWGFLSQNPMKAMCLVELGEV
jgi:hypothetical protein